MKNTKIINGLTVEFKNNSAYVILNVRRVDCSTIDSATFSKYITEDLLKADKIYSDMREPFLRAEHENKIKHLEENIYKAAEAKYKRQSLKDKFIAQSLAAIDRDANYTSTISFVDFEPEPSAVGIPNACILSVDNVKEKAPRCFDIIKDNKYFKNAKGWIIKYQTFISPSVDIEKCGLRNSFRPWVEMILDDNLQKELEENWCKTVADVEHFYDKCEYFGD